MKKLSYLSPEIEIIEIAIEKGFAQSGGPANPAKIDPWGSEEF
jgi:hypothetical protein